MFKVLKTLLNKTEIQELDKFLVYKLNDNLYEMYGSHTITVNNEEYIVNKTNTYTTVKFNNLRNAVIWTIMDKTNNIVAANKLRELDIKYFGNLVEIEQQKRFINTKDFDRQLLAEAKLKEYIYKNSKILEEIDHYAEISNRWQHKQFNQLIKS